MHSHCVQPLDNTLLVNVDTIPDEVDQEGIGRRLNSMRIPLLLKLGLQQITLVVFVHTGVGLDGLSGPVDKTVYKRVQEILYA